MFKSQVSQLGLLGLIGPTWCQVGAAGLLAAILPVTGVTRLRFLAEFFRILGDLSLGFAEFLANSGLKNSQRKLYVSPI